MTTSKKNIEIPRGNTCPGVNEAIIEYLSNVQEDFGDEVFFDMPCGEGEFLQAVKNFFPQAKTVGADINVPKPEFAHKFLRIDAREQTSLELEEKAGVITCISGVVEFDNTVSFFDMLRTNLDERGIFIVTNDNLLTVRDRLLYLLFGRFRQYHLFIRNDQPSWNITPLQNLLRMLAEGGFETLEIKYAPIKTAEWLWLPLAGLIYIFQNLYLRFGEAEKKIGYDEKIARYPFMSLLSRHYIVICRVKR